MLFSVNYNEEEIKEVNDLVEYIISTKEFFLDANNITEKYHFLLTNQILKEEDGYLIIANYEVIVLSIYNQLSKNYNYIPSTNIENLFNFLEKCRIDLNDGRNLTGKADFFRNYYKIILDKLSDSFKFDFFAFIITFEIKGDTRGFTRFIEAFFSLLPKLNLENEEIIGITKKLTLSGYWDSIIYNGIKNYTKNDSVRGKSLLNYSISYNSPVPVVEIATLQELYNSDRNNINLIQGLVSNKEKHILILNIIIPLIVKENEQDFKEFIKIIETIESEKSTDSLLIIPSIYSHLINNTNKNNYSDLEFYFNRLYKFLLLKDQNIIRNTLFALQRIHSHEFRVKDLIIKYLRSDSFNSDLSSEIANVFNFHKNAVCFFEFLSEFTEQNRIPFNVKDYEYVLENIREADTIIFDAELTKLLINNRGEIRFIGCLILAHLTTSQPLNFTFDILSLDPLSQYKFLLSTLHVLLEPSTILPLILPLAKSKNEFVKEAFICKIEELTSTGYGKGVIEVLTSYLNIEDAEEAKHIERIQKYYANHSKRLDERLNIKELDPYFIQAGFLEKFNNIYRKRFNKTVSEGVKNNSVIMQLSNNITLAKGGGWKHEDQEEIMPLNRFESSFTLPKSMFIYSELIDWERQLFFSDNWTNEFDEIIHFF